MIKKSICLAAAAALLGGALTANAQLFPYTGTSTAPSSSVTEATGTTASSTISSSTTSSTVSTTTTMVIPPSATSSASTSEPSVTSVTAEPVVVTSSGTASSSGVPVTTGATGSAGAYLQMDGLTVVNVSTASQPQQVLASDRSYSATGNTIVTCTQFATDNDPTGTATACPVPPLAPATGTAADSSGTVHSPYTIYVNAATNVLRRDRTATTLANIAPGDTVNVYGFYNGDGTIEATILRDASSNVSGSGTATATTGSTAAFQAELDQLAALVAQLEAEVAMISTSTTTTPSTTAPTTPTSTNRGY